MPHRSSKSLRDFLCEAPAACRLWGADANVAFGDLVRGSALGGGLRELADRSVLIATHDQLSTALALIELDGVAARMVLCPPDLPADQLAEVMLTAQVDAVVTGPDGACPPGLMHVVSSPEIKAVEAPTTASRRTEWIMLTSGTSGTPKLVVHTRDGLTAAIKAGPREPVVWATFYDMRRYGGLQIFLRAVLGGASLVLSHAGESTAAHLERLAAHGVTHLTGTPSHWRWVLLNPSANAIAPRYARLSGEIADQAILDGLREGYPNAAIGHAYASTEAGVAFEVTDGREGFPATLIGGEGRVRMQVVDGALRIASNGTAERYLGRSDQPLRDNDGFVDTGDIVELRGDRFYFVGRRGGIINVGGLKVHPEEIEAIINRHPGVRMSLVRARRNPITGAVVVADVVPRGRTERPDRALEHEILEVCRRHLPQHKVPAAIRLVSSLEVSAGGKILRPGSAP
jgi:acyl-coenzyme A synthetase/AMP-(fatty) acid ligase